jgi:hypothetical protein
MYFKRQRGNTYRMAGAQLATITLFAPLSFAICTISLDVVPRTIESIAGERVIHKARIIYEYLTIDQKHIFSGKLQGHSI